MRKHLLVNGVGITFLTPITKVMAHLPLASLTHKPESALVICLGMGTTLRSLHSWGIDATAVELVPSVRDAFPYYFSDASEIMKDPKVHIVIDDGRRFLKRTEKKFDVITIDPPPPIEAAGSSLLYSEQFYSLVKAHLTPNGIFQQWFPGGERRIGQAIYKSLENSFRYVRIFRSIDRGNGLHFLASDNPIPNLTTEELIKKLPPQALKDLMEWNSKADPVAYLNRVISSELTSSHIQADNVAINDDKPVNEYFVLRRSLMGTLNEPTL